MMARGLDIFSFSLIALFLGLLAATIIRRNRRVLKSLPVEQSFIHKRVDGQLFKSHAANAQTVPDLFRATSAVGNHVWYVRLQFSC